MKHNRIDFAALCGLSAGNLANYIKSGKVILTGKLVDDEIEQNSYFLTKRQRQAPNKTAEKLPEGKKAPVIKPNLLDVEKTRKQIDMLDLEKKKKLVDLAHAEQQNRISILKERKMLGQDIPTELVRMLFNQTFKSFLLTIKDGQDRHIVDIAKKARLNQNDIAQLRKQMVAMLNKASERALLMVEREIEQMEDPANGKAVA